jgi:hypothetical protein
MAHRPNVLADPYGKRSDGYVATFTRLLLHEAVVLAKYCAGISPRFDTARPHG